MAQCELSISDKFSWMILGFTVSLHIRWKTSILCVMVFPCCTFYTGYNREDAPITYEWHGREGGWGEGNFYCNCVGCLSATLNGQKQEQKQKQVGTDRKEDGVANGGLTLDNG